MNFLPCVPSWRRQRPKAKAFLFPGCTPHPHPTPTQTPTHIHTPVWGLLIRYTERRKWLSRVTALGAAVALHCTGWNFMGEKSNERVCWVSVQIYSHAEGGFWAIICDSWITTMCKQQLFYLPGGTRDSLPLSWPNEWQHQTWRSRMPIFSQATNPVLLNYFLFKNCQLSSCSLKPKVNW